MTGEREWSRVIEGKGEEETERGGRMGREIERDGWRSEGEGDWSRGKGEGRDRE